MSASDEEPPSLFDKIFRHGLDDKPFKSTSVKCFERCRDCIQSLGEGDCVLLLLDLDRDTAKSPGLIAELGRTLRLVPTIVLVDHGDIPTAIRAIKAGAVNCFEKSIDTGQLCVEIEALLGQTAPNLSHSMETLTPMEKTVLHHILQGRTNHETAEALCRSPRTIEVHRTEIMRKLGAASVVDLVKTSVRMGLLPDWP